MDYKERSEIAKMVTANILFVFSKLNEYPEVFKQYAQTINLLSKCYIDDQANAVILAAINGDLAIVSVNTSEMEVAQIITASHEYVIQHAMEDAPEKSLFN
jgi:hypothetical protein